MNYVKEQITLGFELWLTENRLKPNNFSSDEENNQKDVDVLASEMSEALTDYIDANSSKQPNIVEMKHPAAYEYHNHKTGHAFVDYDLGESIPKGIENIKDYTKTPLFKL